MFTSLLLLALLQPANAVSPLPDQRFIKDLHDKKIDDVLTLYAADAVFVNPDGEKIANGPALRKLYEQVTSSFDSDLHLHLKTIEQMGRSVQESGEYTETLRHRDTGKVEEVHGSYLFAGRLEADGQWRFTRMEWH
jgi:ketosteroid isomerase-like protein